MARSWRQYLALGAIVFAAALASLPAAAADAGSLAKSAPQHTTTSYAVTLFGEPKYPANFKNFDYVNPDAPKGGTVHLSALGSYDSFSPFAMRGTSAVSLILLNVNLIYDSLTVVSLDERATQYCLLCESITWPDDYSWMEFKIRPTAKFHDGVPVTADDVVFTLDAIKNHGTALYATVFQQISKVEKTGPMTVRISFVTPGNRRNLWLMGPFPVAPKHYWQGKDFGAPAVTPPLGSGPYVISSYEIGRSLTLTRAKDYWAKDLAVTRGRFNYDRIVTDYFRDSVIAFEAFKAGAFDVRLEQSPKNWAVGYNFPQVQHGNVLKITTPTQGFLYQAFFYNTRRPQFQDPVLREALGYAFDFNWMNKNLFYNFYKRTRSVFGTDELAAKGLPSAAELKLLEPYRNQLPPRVFTTEFNPPDTDGTVEGLRNNLRIAAQMLQKAGYVIQDGKMISPVTHKPLTMEILISDPTYELASMHWADNLKLLGISVNVRRMDLPQYIKTIQSYNFDVISFYTANTATPGGEQRYYWGMKAADSPGSSNYAGVKSPAVDALIVKMLAATNMDELETATHALDRVISWGFYTVPQYSSGGTYKIAYWDRFGRPAARQTSGFGYADNWWIDPKKDATINSVLGTTN